MKLFEDIDDIDLEPTDSEAKVSEFLKIGVLLTDEEKEELEENGIGEWLYDDDYGIVDFDILLTVNTGTDIEEYPWSLFVIQWYNGEPRLEFVDAVTDWFANAYLSTSLKEYKERFHLEEDLDVDLELDDPEIWFEDEGNKNHLQIFLSDRIKKNILDVIDKSQDGGVVEDDDGFGGYRLNGYHGMYWGAIHHVENNWYVEALSKYGWFDRKLVVYEQVDEYSGSGVLEIEYEDVEKFLKDVGLSEDSINVIMNREKVTEDIDDIDFDADEPTIEINQYGQGILTKENISKLYNIDGIKTETSIYRRFYVNCLYIRNQTLEQFSNGLFLIRYDKSSSSYHGHECYQISKLGRYDNGETLYDGSIEITSEVALEIGLTEGDLNTLKNSGLAYDEMADLEDDDDVYIDDNEIVNESDEDPEDSFDLDDSTVTPSMVRHNKHFLEFTYENQEDIEKVYNIVLNSKIFNKVLNGLYKSQIEGLLSTGVELTRKVQVMIRGYKQTLCEISFGVYHQRNGIQWFSYCCDSKDLTDATSDESEFIVSLGIKLFDDEQSDIITEDIDSDIDLEDSETMEQKYGPTELLRLYIVGTDECAVVDNYVFEMDSFGDEYFVDSLFRVNEDGSISKLDYPSFDTEAEENSFCRVLLSIVSKETKESLLTRFNIHDIPEKNKYDDIQDCINSLSLENGWEDYESFMTYLSNTGY